MSSPTADDVKKILTAVNAKVDETCLAKVKEYNMLDGVLERGVKEFKAQEYRIVSIHRSIYIYT